MIDDINTSDTEKWKYVDDTAIVEPVVKNWASTIQVYVNKLVAKLDANKSQLNDSKCKETRISFAKIDDEFAPVIINGKEIEVVFSFSYLAWTFERFEMNCMSRVRNFPQGLGKEELKPLRN